MYASLQHAQRVAERQILENDVLLPATGPGNRAQDHQQEFEHGKLWCLWLREFKRERGRMKFWRTTP